MGFACIDFETANFQRSSACALGVAIVEGEQIQIAKSWLFRPTPYFFEPICISKHGLGEALLATALSFKEQWDDIATFIGDRCLVAHNASFDISVFRNTLMAHGLQVPRFEYLCTLQIGRILWKYPSHSLAFLASQFDIDLLHHDALSDARACAELLLRAKRDLNCKCDTEFLRALPVKPGTVDAHFGDLRPQTLVASSARQSIGELFSGRLADLRGVSVSTTGTLGRGLTREHLIAMVQAAGGEFHPTPKKSTKLFVVGETDVRRLSKDSDLSTKHIRAMELFASGVPIEIVSAGDFLDMLTLEDPPDTPVASGA